MRCFNGLSVKGALVPCGKCQSCRVNHARVWAGRILMEQACHPTRAYFVTQTYDDQHLPRTPDGVPTLHKAEYKAYIDATRRRNGPFRYFAVGEYGDDTMRPHYHMVLFPRDDRQATSIAYDWDKGFITLDELTPRRARYIAGYAAKKLTKDTDERLASGQTPEFSKSSVRPGIGAEFARALVHTYRTSLAHVLEARGDIERTFRVSGKIYPISRYVLDRARKELGIPLLHRDRCVHPGYLIHHGNEQFAEKNPCEATKQKEKLNAQKKQRRLRSTTQTI